jgi:hypothetical protein
VIEAMSPKSPNRRRGMPVRTVRDALDRLAERPGLTSHRAITIIGSTETRPATRKWVGRGRSYWAPEDFDAQPIITVAPELRAVEKDPIRLGDLTADLMVDGIREFVRQDTSRERLKELRDRLARLPVKT